LTSEGAAESVGTNATVGHVKTKWALRVAGNGDDFGTNKESKEKTSFHQNSLGDNLFVA
jgi:hypothetical protein